MLNMCGMEIHPQERKGYAAEGKQYTIRTERTL